MTPTTDAGRALLAGLTDDDPEARTLLSDIEPAILAIEAEARADLLARLRADVLQLAHLTPEDWAERRGADPIARTINAVLDAIRVLGERP